MRKEFRHVSKKAVRKASKRLSHLLATEFQVQERRVQAALETPRSLEELPSLWAWRWAMPGGAARKALRAAKETKHSSRWSF